MKKREVKPFIEKDKRAIILKLSFLTGVSIQTIGDDLCRHAIRSDFAIYQAQHFQHSIKIKNLQFAAQENPLPIPQNNNSIERISFRIDSSIYEYSYSLSYAMGISVPKVIARMIHFSMEDKEFFNNYVLKYLSSQIDEERKELLASIVNDLNGRLPRTHTVTALLFYIADEMKQMDESMGNRVEEFVSQWTV